MNNKHNKQYRGGGYGKSRKSYCSSVDIGGLSCDRFVYEDFSICLEHLSEVFDFPHCDSLDCDNNILFDFKKLCRPCSKDLSKIYIVDVVSQNYKVQNTKHNTCKIFNKNTSTTCKKYVVKKGYTDYCYDHIFHDKGIKNLKCVNESCRGKSSTIYTSNPYQNCIRCINEHRYNNILDHIRIVHNNKQ
jgi:hypothetical protein